MSEATSARYEYPHLFRLLHWVLSVSFVILVLTGLSLHAAARPGWSVFAGVVPEWLWRGRVYIWHYWASVAFIPAVLGSAAFCWHKRFWVHSTHPILIGGGLVMILTGLWLMYPFGPYAGIKTAVGLHAVFGLVILPLAFLWHAVIGFTKYLSFLVSSFRPLKNPRWSQLVWFIPLALLTTWIMFEGWPLRPPWRNLVAKPVTVENPDNLATLPWNKAEPLAVRMLNGSAFYSGQTDLTLQALHNGKDLFVKAQWRDPIEDYAYWPWKKTNNGWEYLQTSSKDETVHYEDKFSLIFPITPSWHFEQVGCALYCHVDGKYGWGYKGGQPDVDVWHWKSTRTDPHSYVDDKYWSVLDFTAMDVGRHGDPAEEGGGYAKNVAKDDASHPAFLPNGSNAVRHGALPKELAVEYTQAAADRIEPEAIVPGIIVAPCEGDRGDVRCQSLHENDRWTLYIRRALDTGSEHDTAFLPGGVYPFGCAAFDHAAKRHAYSMPVFRLVVEK